MLSPQTTFLPKLQSCTDQDNAWALFIDRVAWPPSGRSCVAEHTLGEGQGCLDETCATRGSSQVHYCTLHINAYYCILLHYCTLHQCIIVVLFLGYFQLNENGSSGREHQLHPVRLGRLVIFTRAANCISMGKIKVEGGGSN